MTITSISLNFECTWMPYMVQYQYCWNLSILSLNNKYVWPSSFISFSGMWKFMQFFSFHCFQFSKFLKNTSLANVIHMRAQSSSSAKWPYVARDCRLRGWAVRNFPLHYVHRQPTENFCLVNPDGCAYSEKPALLDVDLSSIIQIWFLKPAGVAMGNGRDSVKNLHSFMRNIKMENARMRIVRSLAVSAMCVLLRWKIYTQDWIF